MKLFKTLSLMMLALPGALLTKDFRDYQDLAEHGDKELILDGLDANSSADLSNVPVVEMLSMKFVPGATVEKLAGQKMMAKKQALQAGLKAKPAGTPAASPSASPDSLAEAARVKALEDEVARLRAQLAASQGGAAAGAGASSTAAVGGEKVRALEKRIAMARENLDADQKILDSKYSAAAGDMNYMNRKANVQARINGYKKQISELEANKSSLLAGEEPAVSGGLTSGIQGGVTLAATGNLANIENKPAGTTTAAPAQKSAAQIMAEQAQKRAEEMAARRAAAAASSGSVSPLSTGSSSGSSSPVSVPAFGLPNRPGNKPVGSPVVAPVVGAADEATKFEGQWSAAKNPINKAQLIKPLPDDYTTASPVDQAKISYILGLDASLIPGSVKDKVAAWRTQVGQ